MPDFDEVQMCEDFEKAVNGQMQCKCPICPIGGVIDHFIFYRFVIEVVLKNFYHKSGAQRGNRNE